MTRICKVTVFFLTFFFLQTVDGEVDETADDSFVEDAADIDARRMAMKAAEGLQLDLKFLVLDYMLLLRSLSTSIIY